MAQGRAREALKAGRPPLQSPGRPPVNRREERQRFWRLIAQGLQREEAAVACGVSMPLGPRWFREGGGMPPISLDPSSGRGLSFAEREEIAILRAQKVRGAGDRPPSGAGTVDDLAGTAAQCGHPRWPSGLSRLGRAVARRPPSSSPQAVQAGRQRRAPAVCAKLARRSGHHCRWRRRAWPGRTVDRASSVSRTVGMGITNRIPSTAAIMPPPQAWARGSLACQATSGASARLSGLGPEVVLEDVRQA